MESSHSVDEGDDLFDEVIDEFPFHDCNGLDVESDQQSSSTNFSNLRQRRIHQKQENHASINTTFSSNEISFQVPAERSDSTSSTAEVNERIDHDSWVLLSPCQESKTNEEATEASIVTAVDDESVGEFDEEADSNFLIDLSAFVIKAIGFQFNLFLSMASFPFWCFSTFLTFIMDPFSIMSRGRKYLIAKLLTTCNSIWKTVNPFHFLGDRKSICELAWKFSVGLLRSIYICSILLVLLFSAILITGFTMRFLAAEPIVMEERLNFDYTKNSPVAYMPIAFCGGSSCGHQCEAMVETDQKMGSRIIPPNRKLSATVKLTLPESEYNRNLGMFQVKVELLSANGEAVTSSSHPCMLPFKSEPIRLFMTLLKLVPLIAGYISESQTIAVQLRGLVEHNVPSTCLKVSVEQRAQFHSGGGVPEIYDASLTLEMELPFVKRVMWNWRRTLFVWTTMVFFIMELMIMLICCRPVFLPRVRC